MIHINWNILFYTYVEHSPTKTIHNKHHMERQTTPLPPPPPHTHTHTHTKTTMNSNVYNTDHIIHHTCVRVRARTHTHNKHTRTMHTPHNAHTHNVHAHTLKQSVLSMFEHICGTVYKIAMFLTSFSVGCLVPSLCLLIPFFIFFIFYSAQGFRLESWIWSGWSLPWLPSFSNTETIHSCRITCERSESAWEWRIALYKSDQ